MKRRAAAAANLGPLKSESSSSGRSASSNNIEVAQRAKRYESLLWPKVFVLPRVWCYRKRSGFLGDDSCIENAGTKRRKLRAGVRKKVSHDVEESEEAENLDHNEVLDEMGLNILSDNSNSCDTIQLPLNIRSKVGHYSLYTSMQIVNNCDCALIIEPSFNKCQKIAARSNP